MKIKFGAWVDNLNELRQAHEEKIGNAFGLVLPKNLKDALELVQYCREHRLHFIFREIVSRCNYELPTEELFAGKLSAEEFRQVLAAAGEYYLGRVVIGESGGMLYWPLEYLREPYLNNDETYLGGPYSLLPPAIDLPEAEKNYRDRLLRFLDKEKTMGGEPFWDVDGSMVFRTHLECGVKVPYLEMLPGNPERMLAALRGAARAFGCREFGTLIAFAWYGGGVWDDLYLKRWRNALYYSYLAGVTAIHSESGHFGFKYYRNQIGENDPNALEFRKIMADFARFCAEDDRPDDGPDVRVGFLYGNLDGYPGLWSNSVWGQYENPDFRCGDAEKSWNLLNAVTQKQPWYDNLNIGESDLSGQPAAGMYDIVPAGAPPDVMVRYSCLVLLGWNTMTPELYAKLKDYVKNGGHLIAALPHLCTNTERTTPFRPYNNGDWSDLFGVAVEGQEEMPVTGIKFNGQPLTPNYSFPDWGGDCDPKFMGKGFPAGKIIRSEANVLAFSSKYFFSAASHEKTFPILLENKCGAGSAFLINAWAYPGNENLFDFYRVLLTAVMRAEQPENLKVVCDGKIRYAVYGDAVYLLNTDGELPAHCRIVSRGKTTQIALSPLEIRKAILSRTVGQ